ncbi:MAG: hypothetical protein KJN62_07725 [Deltaproteobacteria bacterium]|nr:hypothetical protein [Deltaproteobacteria bacterium]
MLIQRTKVNIAMINSVRFYPGINNLTDEQTEKVKDHKSFKNMLENGTHILIEKPSENDSKKKTANIAEMSTKNALKIIEGTHLISMLESYSEDEQNAKDRKKVQMAIADKIEEMKKIPGKEDK